MSQPIILFDIDYTLFDTAKFKNSGLTEYHLYSDTLPALKRLGHFATLGVLSEARYAMRDGKLVYANGVLTPGSYKFQMNKLIRTDCIRFFAKEHIYIIVDKKVSLQKILGYYKNTLLFFVEDKFSILEFASSCMPDLQTIWLRRGPYAKLMQDKGNFIPSHTIDSLSEIVSIVYKYRI